MTLIKILVMKTNFTLIICLLIINSLSGQRCSQPLNLSVSNITATSASLHWTAGNVGGYPTNGYLVQYGIKGFTYGTGKTVLSPGLGITISGLSSNTAYDFYVRKRCLFPDFGTYYTYSQISGPKTFTTNKSSVKLFNLSGVRLHPNPTRDLLEISAADSINEIRIYSISGEEMYRKKINELYLKVDLSGFKAGLYIVHVYTGKGTGVYKIVKE